MNEFRLTVKLANDLITKESIRRPKRLNDSFDTNSTEANVLATPPSLSANEITVTENFTVKSINSHGISGLLRSDSNLDLENLTITHLVIANNSDNFKAIETKLIEVRKQRNKRQSTDTVPEEFEPFALNDVVLNGKLNGLRSFEYLYENALRKNADTQQINGDTIFGSMNVTSMLNIKNNEISNVHLNRIVNIRGEHALIYPSIHFTQKLVVDKLEVLERLMQILIRDKKMDILFRRSGKRVQLITGQKTFQSVLLREPINLQGRINVSSPIFSRIKPITTIDEDIFLDGDFTISGNATVQNILKSGNMFGPSLHFNVQQLEIDGLRIDDQNIDTSIEFLQPIQTENIQSTPLTRLNGISIDNFIKRDAQATQSIFARKTFTNGLAIENGVSEITEINGINLQALNETMLKKSAKNQTIIGTIQVKRIIAERYVIEYPVMK